ncbi:hydantoinase/oxoprolinase family protein [Rhodoferax sp.]|jgi:N-methylhydantoinase A/oxoprolinase/acetone carboxylase beta subunit|uniref:hydantoinase/oxoprolinase family protein n=1 Tax=Rhodoferax sp. TaxID=50421 RepID=UPI00378501BE
MPAQTAAPSYLVGVDTGGTYTDAAIIEAHGHRVVATAKAITTKGDLAVGVGEALSAALAQLQGTVAPQQIAMVSVSTTLATNAVVEGHGSAVGVVLVGFDAAMVQRTGIAKAFPELPLAVVAGGHNHNGDALCPLDEDALAHALDGMAPAVDAFAVASTFAVRNPAHEHAVRDHIVARTGKPVTLSTELSSSLDAPRRALTAVLNARLIARISGLIDAVQRAMVALQIQCPLMIVKGDGSLALAESVATRPIETVLSGPAASLVGAQWLSGLQSFILSDMGGTTTDLGLLIDGRPKVKEEGAEVGGWRTMVRAIDVRTIGLGGDSEISAHPKGGIAVGPQRVAPVSLVAARYPETIAMLQADLADVDGGSSLHGKFVLLPFSAKAQAVPVGLSPREREALASVTAAPQPLRKIANSLPAQRALESLRRKGLVQLCSFTPSDAGHVLGLQANWSADAAYLAAQLAARLRDMKLPTPERTRQFAQDVWEQTVRLSCRAVLQTAFGSEVADSPLIDTVCSGQATLGWAQVRIQPSVPVVAVGGPVRVFYPEVARRLGCEVAFAPHCDVANAVGAAAGVVAHSITVRVVGDGTGNFRVHAPSGTRQFSNPTEALDTAHAWAEQLARSAVLAMGAHAPEVQVSVQKQWMPNAVSDAGLLEAVVQAEAIGRPTAAR